MKLLNINFYTIKIDNNLFLNITYNNNLGIIYSKFKNNTWSPYSILTKNCTKSFTTVLLPNKKIAVIYQNKNGNIILSIYFNNKWAHKEILKWKKSELVELDISSLYYANKIHLFYSVSMSSNSKNKTLFYQNVDMNFSVSKPHLVDNNIFKVSKSFSISSLDNGTLIILYEKLLDNYSIGYKILNCEDYTFSDYYIIDKNISPYIDFTLCCNNNIIHSLYVKNNSLENILIHASGYLSDFNYITILKNTNTIALPCFFKFNNTIYDIWINNTSMYYCYSTDNGINISELKKEQLPNTLIKTNYLSFLDNYTYNTNYIYINFDNTLTFYPHSLYASIKNASSIKDTSLCSKNFNLKKYIFNVENKFSYYKQKLDKKNQIITQLNYLLEKEKQKSLVFNNKLSEMENNYLNLQIKYDSITKKESECNDLKEQLNTQSHNSSLEKFLVLKKS